MERRLQHERQGQTSASRRAPDRGPSLPELARQYVGAGEDGALADPDLRSRLTTHLMDARAHALTVDRVRAEAGGNVEVSAADTCARLASAWEEAGLNPADHIALVHRGQRLDADKTIGDFNIVAGARINVAVKHMG